MKDKTTCLLLLLNFLACKPVFTQQWLWTKQFGSKSLDRANALATDLTGNFYIAGHCYDTAYFGGCELESRGFVAKYDVAGNCIWVNATPREGKDVTASNVEYVYTCGDGFLSAFDWWGNPQWHKTVNVQFKAVSTDADGNLYVTGSYYSDTLTIDGHSLYSGINTTKVVTAKFAPNGSCHWLRSSVAALNKYAYSEDIVTANNGTSYITGYFRNGVSFPPFALSDTGYSGGFVVAYDSAGNCMWANSFGGNDSSGSSQLQEGGKAICLDAQGNVLLTGALMGNGFFGNMQFEGGSRNNNAFVAKYAPNGNLLWAKQYGGVSDDEGTCITTDIAGNIYWAGVYAHDTIFFDNLMLLNTNHYDVFVVKLNSHGDANWAVSAGGYTWNEMPFGISYSGNTVTLTGMFYNMGYFGPDTLLANGMTDVFLSQIGDFNQVKNLTGGTGQIVYPNPGTNVVHITQGSTTLQTRLTVYAIDGRKIESTIFSSTETTLYTSSWSSGLYFIELVSGEHREVIKWVKE